MNSAIAILTNERYVMKKIRLGNSSFCATGWYDIVNWKLGLVPEIDFKWHYGNMAVSVGPLELELSLSILDNETVKIMREWEFSHIENAGEIEDDWEAK